MRIGLLLIAAAAVAMAQAPASAPKPPAAAKPKPAAAKPKPAAAKPAELTTDEEKTIYSLGLSIYRSLAPFDLTPGELELVKRGLADAAAGKPAVDVALWMPKIQAMVRERSGRVAAREKEAAKAYLEKAAAEPGAVKTESGMIYKELRAGTGESPKATDTVKVNYRGTLVNGTEFDSSYKRGQPAQFALNGVIKCWTEGVQKMKAGGKAQLVCPSELAYGDRGQGPIIPGGAALIFEIELLEIVAPPAPATK